MFPEQLKKILNLIKKTGDRVVVFDASQPDESYVIMDFDRYSRMNLTDESSQKEVAPKVEKTEISPVNSDLNEKKENLTEEDLTDKINREISMWKNRENLPYLAEEEKTKKAWQIPPQVKNKAQEVE
jgi:hypothetical protein